MLRRFSVFISSPGDVEGERDAACQVMAQVAARHAAHLAIEWYDYRDASFNSRSGFQEQVPDVAGYDLVLGVVWKRLGTPLNPNRFAPGAGPHASGTQYEIETALAAAAAHGRPEVVVWRKTAPVSYDEAEVEWQLAQHRALKAWWREQFGEHRAPVRRASIEFADTDAFADAFERWLEDWLRRVGAIPAGPLWDVEIDGSPYPGLPSYDARTSRVFHGRDASLRRALALLRRRTAAGDAALFVVGPSGSGKSSFVLAGLVPRLVVAGGQAGAGGWRTLVLTPGAVPLAQLATRLYGEALPEIATSPQTVAAAWQALAEREVKAAAGVVAWALARAGNGQRLLIVADQLETLVEQAAGTSFTAMLLALVREARVTLIATLRSNRYPLLQQDTALAALRGDDGVFDLPPPGLEALREIIDRSAEDAGLDWDRDAGGLALNERLAADAGSADALPLVQMTLHRLFEQRLRPGNVLSLASYRAMGGLAGAIASRADDVLAGLAPEAAAELDAVLGMFVGDALRELDAGAGDELVLGPVSRQWVEARSSRCALVDAFVAARLMVADGAFVRVAHEALIRQWPRALNSAALQPQALRLARTLKPLASAWRASAKAEDLTLAPALLAQAHALLREAPNALDDEVSAFVRAAQAAMEAQRAAELATARSREGAAASRLEAAEDQERALELALDAYDTAPTPEAESALREALHVANALAVAAPDRAVSDLAWVPGTPWMLSAHVDGSVLLWDAAGRTGLREVLPSTGPLTRTLLAVHPATCRLAVVQDSQILLLSLPGFERLAESKTFNGIRSVSFAPDGSALLISHGASLEVLELPSLSSRLRRNGTVIVSARFSGDGRQLIGHFDDGYSVDLWSADDGQSLFHGGTRSRCRGSAGDQQNRWLVAIATGGASAYNLYDRASAGGRGVPLGESDDESTCIVWLDDRGEFAIGYRSGLVLVWQIELPFAQATAPEPDWRPAPRLLKTLIAHRSGVTALAFSATRGVLAAAGEEGAVRLWRRKPPGLMSPASWSEAGMLLGHGSRVTTMAFDESGRMLASMERDGPLRWWRIGSVREGPVARMTTAPAPYGVDGVHVEALDFSTDGSRLLSRAYGGAAWLWDGASGKLIAHLARGPKGSLLHTSDEAYRTTMASLSADGGWILSLHGDGAVALWHAADGRAGAVLAVKGDPIVAAAFLPGAGRVLTLGGSGELRWWVATSGRCTRKHATGAATVRDPQALALAPAADRIAVGHDNRTVSMWTLQGEWVALLGGDDHPALQPVFEAGAKRLRTSTDRWNEWQWWALGDGRALPPPESTALLPDWTLTDDTWVKRDIKHHLAVWWRGPDGRNEVPKVLRGHSAKVHTVALSADGRWLASADEGETTRLWLLETGRQVGQWPIAADRLAFDPRGRWLVGAGTDGALRWWTLQGSVLSALAKERRPMHLPAASVPRATPPPAVPA